MSEKIEPCPFCGETPIIMRDALTNGWRINHRCKMVSVQLVRDTRTEAITACNDWKECGKR